MKVASSSCILPVAFSTSHKMMDSKRGIFLHISFSKSFSPMVVTESSSHCKKRLEGVLLLTLEKAETESPSI